MSEDVTPEEHIFPALFLLVEIVLGKKSILALRH